MIFYEMKKILLKNSAKVALIFLGGVTLFMIHKVLSMGPKRLVLTLAIRN